jgi:Zn-finger nucleic acid-binding protein
MERCQRGEVRFWRCICGGHVITVTAVRRMLPEGTWSKVWPILRAASSPGSRACPGCGSGMAVSSALQHFGARSLDTCDRCQFLWLDPGEFEAMPKREPPEELPLEARRALAMAAFLATNAEQLARNEADRIVMDALDSPSLDALVKVLELVILGA